MSRLYRIKVSQRMDRVIKASDHVSTTLEILEILPPEQTAELLATELEARGFQKHGRKLVRREKGVTIQVDADTGNVLVRAEAEESLELEASKQVFADRDDGRELTARARKEAEEELRKNLESQADTKKSKLQEQITQKLEGRLQDLQGELNQVVNKVTAESLKRRAAQLGNIKEVSEDPQSGSLKIVVEV